MQAIILAAGMGKRLGDLTKENTKCMIKVNGVTLISRMLGQIDKRNFDRVIIVTGYKEDSLKTHIAGLTVKTPIVYVSNPIYDRTNNIYSLFLVKEFLAEDDTILFESDLIFEDSILDRLINNPYSNVALVAKYETWMDGTMVQINNNYDIINFISKKNFSFKNIDSYHKTVNLYKFSKTFSNSHYIPFLEAYCKAIGHNEYYEQVLRVINSLENVQLKALTLNNEKWYEIDDIQDLDIAEALFSNEENQLPLFQKRYGGYWRFPKLIDFCYLVNPYFPPKKLKEEIVANFDKLLSEYPSGLRINSLLAGKYFNVNPNYTCVGNGASELIKSLMKKDIGKIGIVQPTFDEYINRLNTEQTEVYNSKNDSFTYSSDDLISFFNNKNINTLLLINPDNPSGNFIQKDHVLGLCKWAIDQKMKIIVDESFVDFSDDYENNSLLDNETLNDFPNLIVIKSISKSYGVPGLRLGALFTSDEQLISYLRKDVAIWNINSFAEFYMQIFNKYEDDYKIACRSFVCERERFFAELSKIKWLRIIPSQANFFLCEIINSNLSSYDLMKMLLIKYNIFIKDCSPKVGFNGRNYIRLAVRDTHDNNFLCKALEKIGDFFKQ